MSTIAWIAVWVVVLATVAFFLVREIRSGRKEPDDFDRTTHEAVRLSASRQQVQGPNGMGQTWGS